jgi:hypothetical protein
MKYMSRLGWRVREPPPHRAPEEPSLLASALALLEANDITLEQLADRAHLTSPDDLRDRLRLEAHPTLRVKI